MIVIGVSKDSSGKLSERGGRGKDNRLLVLAQTQHGTLGSSQTRQIGRISGARGDLLAQIMNTCRLAQTMVSNGLVTCRTWPIPIPNYRQGSEALGSWLQLVEPSLSRSRHRRRRLWCTLALKVATPSTQEGQYPTASHQLVHYAQTW